MVTALGKKLSLSLFVLARMDLKRLPEGNRLKRWKPGCVVSFRMFLALLRQQELLMVLKEGRGQLLNFSRTTTEEGRNPALSKMNCFLPSLLLLLLSLCALWRSRRTVQVSSPLLREPDVSHSLTVLRLDWLTINAWLTGFPMDLHAGLSSFKCPQRSLSRSLSICLLLSHSLSLALSACFSLLDSLSLAPSLPVCLLSLSLLLFISLSPCLYRFLSLPISLSQSISVSLSTYSITRMW